MLGYRSLLGVVSLWVAASCLVFGQDQDTKPQLRNPVLLDVLARVVNAAGGVQALAAVHDLTESGEITFHWEKGVEGPVTIQALGGNHFRMEADLPQAKRVWVVNDGVGSRKEADQKAVALPYSNAINFGGLTFPIAHVAAVMADPAAEVSLVGIEKPKGRSVYHLRLKGRLGLVGNGTPAGSVVKDVLVDALTFQILTVEDYPYSRKPYPRSRKRLGRRSSSPESNGKASDTATREIAYEDFRVVNGIRVPFSINIKLDGQRTFDIRLDEAVFNTNLSDSDFAK
jgi:hypothetical protein